jgi:hypothetical protein
MDKMIDNQSVTDDYYSSVRNLVKSDDEIKLPVESGTRVSFVHSLDAALTYPDMPPDNAEGLVVTVKTAFGKGTSFEGYVCVLWDTGKFQQVLPRHLTKVTAKKLASSFKFRVADLGDLASFFGQSVNASDELVHKSTNDLWSLKKDGESYVIERLFDDTGSPIKEY